MFFLNFHNHVPTFNLTRLVVELIQQADNKNKKIGTVGQAQIHTAPVSTILRKSVWLFISKVLIKWKLSKLKS